MSLTEIVMLLARASTNSQRVRALQTAARSGRFSEEQRLELTRMAGESQVNERLIPLRPVMNPVERCQQLRKIETCSSTVRPSAEIVEWLGWWERVEELALNQKSVPGPLLLNGPTGSGKTTLAEWAACQIPGRIPVCLDAHAILDSHMGSTGQALDKAFAAVAHSNGVLVLEEMDAFGIARCSGKDGAGQENNRITTALMRLFDNARFPIIATTNRAELLDPALLRRFETTILIDEPALDYRVEILSGIIGGDPGELGQWDFSVAVREAKKRQRRKFFSDRK